jgi:uroporphyrinogen-III synthase
MSDKRAMREEVPVLLTRPEAQSHAFAAALVARFGDRVRPVVAPLMVVEYLATALPDGNFAAVIFTSANGVEAAARLGVPLPQLAWCVGAKTAQRAREAGFQARSTDGDAAALVAAIVADPPAGRLLHLRGQDARGAVAETLNSAGIETESIVVYRQRPLALPGAAVDLLCGDGVLIVPLFSPRSAALFTRSVPADLKADLRVATMSDAVATEVAIETKALIVARRPDADAMLEAIGDLLAMTPPP